jgi:hypothetical protein
MSKDLPRLFDAIRRLRQTGYCAHLSMFLGVLASSLGTVGRNADGLMTINQALD